MAKETTKDIAKKEIEKISKTAEINEAYFVGLLWADPYNNYSEFSDSIAQEEFIHGVWSFYYELGRLLYKEGIKTFDDITVHTKVKQYNLVDEFEEYGKLAQIEDAVSIVKENMDNVGYYYETIKKNHVIRQLVGLFGEKVLINKGKYKWDEMTRDQLTKFWTDKMNKIGLDNINNYEAENLYIEPEEFIRKLEEESAEMLPYYKSVLLNSISQGVARGHVTMIGGFGGTGKSSITAEKFVMSCVVNREKTLVVLNEEDAQSFRQKIVLSILWHEHKLNLDRKKMVNGKLGENEKTLIKTAFKTLKELLDEENGLIKLVFMDKYIMKDLEKIVRFWANRGYINLLIDTHKPSDESTHDSRWETFVEDMKTIYRFTRKNSGGLNLRTVVTFQLADGAIRNRYLDFEAIGEGKKAKNEASVMYMFRTVWADEFEGENKEITYYKLIKQDNGTYKKKWFTLKAGKTYYLWFTPKNRFGEANDNGQPVMVIEPHFNSNTFTELGWCFIANEKSGR